MNRISIKAHTRRGKNGKIKRVRGYTRRVGLKGVHSLKEKRAKPGDELKAKMNKKSKVEEIKSEPTMSPEELEAKRKRFKEWQEDAKRAEAERQSLGMTRHQYAWYKGRQQVQKERRRTSVKSHVNVSPTPSRKKDVFEKIEDKLAKFVDKYGGGKKYKRQL